MSDKGHPHADLMLLYAQRSKTNADEWRNWECRFTENGTWTPLREHPHWNVFYTYRLRSAPPMPKTLYAVIDVQFDKVKYYADEDAAYNALHYLRHDARIEKYVQVPE